MAGPGVDAPGLDGAAFDGAVLCGGASRRMGRDKALIEVDGEPMARRVGDALRSAGAATVTAVGGDHDALTAIGLRTCPDRWPGEGPLGGVITALRSAGAEPTVVVLACDLLRPDAALVGALAAQRAFADADVVVPVTAGRDQWAHAAWRRGAADVLERAFARGARSLHGSVGALLVERFEVERPWQTADADRASDLPGGAPDRAGLRTIPAVELPEIDIPTLAAKQAESALVFDVRQPDEYAEAHVPGVRLIPLDQVPDRVGEFPTDETVYVICKSGGRSAKAVEFLRANGVDAVNVAGGTMAWIEAGKSVDTGA